MGVSTVAVMLLNPEAVGMVICLLLLVLLAAKEILRAGGVPIAASSKLNIFIGLLSAAFVVVLSVRFLALLHAAS